MEPINTKNVTAEHVYIDAQGYDRNGRYWGSGPKLYRLDTKDACQAIVNKYGAEVQPLFIRALSARQARLLATAEGHEVI